MRRRSGQLLNSLPEPFGELPRIGSLIDPHELVGAVAARVIERLAVARRTLGKLGRTEHEAALAAALPSLKDGAPDLLFRSAWRGWLASFEHACDLADRAAAVLGSSARTRPRRLGELFDAVAATTHLLTLAPDGVPDAEFGDRCARLAASQISAVIAELPLVLATQPTARESTSARFAFPIGAMAEIACIEGERPIGTSGYVITVEHPERCWLQLDGPWLHVGRGDQRLVAIDRRQVAQTFAPDLTVTARPRIGATGGMRLGRSLHSSPDVVTIGGLLAKQGERLGAAMATLAQVWPAGWRDVCRFTEVVVPLREPGTVSYSHLARPGYSYINVFTKSALELQDDLVHETAHHELHALEELGALVDDDGDSRYWSPWRRAFRPLRGIIHASYTFTRGAQLFARLADSATPELSQADRRFAQRRLLEEELFLRYSALDLTTAGSEGLLTDSGERLVAELAASLNRDIAPHAKQARAKLCADGASGEAVLAGIEGLDRELGTRSAVDGAVVSL